MTARNSGSDDRCLLHRGTLIEKLNNALRKPVTLLFAPAGAGKTTLVKQWIAAYRPKWCVYMALKLRDREPDQFLARLLDALRQTGVDLSPDTAPTVEAVSAALRSLPEGSLLVLDNLEVADSAAVHDLLEQLLDDFAGSHRWLIVSRTVLPISAGRWGLSHDMTTLSQDDLCLSVADIVTLSRLWASHALNENQARAIWSQTEGWMGGTIFALRAWADAGAPEADLSSFVGESPTIARYLENEVISRLSDMDHWLLVRLSVCETLSASLADALLDLTGSTVLLEELSQKELLFSVMEHEPGLFRCHPMLRQLLESRLRRERLHEWRLLKVRAVHWLRSRYLYHLALNHAIESSDENLTHEVLLESIGYWSREGYFCRVVDAATRFQDRKLLSMPGVVVPLVRAHTLSRRFGRAQRYLNVLRESLDQGRPLCDEMTLCYLELNLQMFRDDTDFRARADLNDFLSQASGHSVYPFLLAMSAYHHAQNTRYEQALRKATEAREALLEAGHNFLASYMDLVIALCHRNTGRLTHVLEDISEAYEMTPASSPAHHLHGAAMVVMLYELNLEKETADLCATLLPALGQTSATEAVTAVYLSGARVLRSRGRQDSARHLLDRLDTTLFAGNYHRFSAQLSCERFRQWLADGHKDRMERSRDVRRLKVLLDSGEWDGPRPYSETWEYHGVATAYWLIQSRRYRRASRLLKVIANVLEQSGLTHRLTVVRAILVIVSDREGRREQAMRELRQLVSDVTLMGLTRSVYDEAPGIGRILFQADQEGWITVPDLYRRMFAAYLDGQKQSETPSPEAVLTEKEQEIFSLLQQGMSNTDISLALGITVATTKWHLKNIYCKLGVSNRTEAVLRTPQASSCQHW